MIDYKAHKSEIIRAKGELMRTTNPYRKRDLRRYIGRLYKDIVYSRKDEIIMIKDAADALEAADKRIAELEAQMPKRGECKKLLRNQWINYYECSICGNRFDDAVNYCPNCGSKMRGEHDERTDKA